MRRVAAVMAMLVVLAGCASGGPMNTPSPEPPGSSPSSPTAPTEVPPAYWRGILADLAGRGVSTDAVSLVSARSVTWNNGALGCPQPGKMYTQALVDGMQVVVTVDGKSYDYRFGRGDRPILCEKVK